MTWIVFTVLLGIIFWGSFVYAVYSKPEPGVRNPSRQYAFTGMAAAAVIWVLLSGALMFHTVGQRQVGIVYNFSGTISGKKDPGVITTAPWQHIRHENVGIQSEEFDLDASNAAVSRDQQPIYARLFLNFQVLPKDVVSLYKNVGPNWKHILLDARVLQDFKETTATFDAASVTINRNQLRAKTRSRLEAELGPYDVKVVDFFVKNLSFNGAYNDAITARNVQKQRALEAQAKVAQVQAEADQAADKADGVRRATIAQAKGEAEAIRIKGSALRANPQVLTLTQIEKISPRVSVIYIPTGANLFLPGGAAQR